MDKTEKPPLSERAWMPFLYVIAASALAHIWCLGSQFFLDDSQAIKLNSVVLSGRFWEGRMNIWTDFVYIIQLRLFGMSAPGIHAVNWLLHTAVACVLFGLARDLLNGREKWRVALFGAVLFAVHPLGSEIPNYARNQDLAWVTLFSLSASWALLSFLRDGDWKKLLACVVFVFGATFSKGPGLLHVLMMSGVVGLAFHTPAHFRLFRRHAGLVVGAVFIGVLALWKSGLLAKFMAGSGNWTDPRVIGHAYTLSRVFWEFAWRSILPISLSADHHIAETLIPVGAKFWNIPDHVAMGAAVAFLAITGFSIFLAWRRSTRLIGVCLLLFVGSILFRVLYPIPEFMPEYRIYPGLPWFCLGAAIVLNAALRKFSEIPPRIPAVILVLVFTFLSAKRSFIWHDLDRLTADILQQYPTQARALWELDDRDVEAGKWQEIITRQRVAWPEVMRLFLEKNRQLAPGRELPTGHFALADVACRGSYAVALAHTAGPPAGMREIAEQEIYMHRLGLDPKAHAIHWSYFFYYKALVLESTGNDRAAIALLSKQRDLPDLGRILLKRLLAKTPQAR